MSVERVLEFGKRAATCRVAVLGDLLADLYVYGRPHKLSREAPIIVLRYEREAWSPGGAGSTVQALAALGAHVTVIGRVGDDPAGSYLTRAMGDLGVDCSRIVVDKDWRTPMKTRFLAGDEHTRKQQVLRVDTEPDGEGNGAVLQDLLDRLNDALDGVDAVIVSDYTYETVTPAMIRRLQVRRSDTFVTVDSRHNLPQFRGVSMATPNQHEAEEAVGIRIVSLDDAREAATYLRHTLDAESVLLTLGNRGMVVCDDREVTHLPVFGSAEAVDVSGAGDVVAATATVARVIGAGAREAAELATLAASVAVMKTGAAPVGVEEMREQLEQWDGAPRS